MIFEHDERNIVLNIDDNADTLKETCYKHVLKLCDINGIELKKPIIWCNSPRTQKTTL